MAGGNQRTRAEILEGAISSSGERIWVLSEPLDSELGVVLGDLADRLWRAAEIAEVVEQICKAADAEKAVTP